MNKKGEKCNKMACFGMKLNIKTLSCQTENKNNILNNSLK